MFGLPNQNKSSASLPFLFDFFELKEKGHFSKKIFIWEIGKKLGSIGPVLQKIKLPWPYVFRLITSIFAHSSSDLLFIRLKIWIVLIHSFILFYSQKSYKTLTYIYTYTLTR